ncbi:hypothetical protein EB118_09245 [bacterium]|nr:hypothetical protein [bacterium]NBX97728.1 hypothetical protein [bacterium]NDC94754.1 hypothetical protein [bacterium]NDD84428.1 hypothetical protein [bacterium]NDG30245.1 hypothetical protein [bacterium]
MAATQQPGSDVAKPGTTPADPTSRPIIVATGVKMTDPMVSTGQDAPAATNYVTAQPSPAKNSGSIQSKITPTTSIDQITEQANKDNDEKQSEQLNAPKPDTNVETATRLNEIIESGEYNVTVHQKNKFSAVQYIPVVAGVVLAAAVIVYVLIDLNIIDISVKLPFELFK